MWEEIAKKAIISPFTTNHSRGHWFGLRPELGITNSTFQMVQISFWVIRWSLAGPIIVLGLVGLNWTSHNRSKFEKPALIVLNRRSRAAISFSIPGWYRNLTITNQNQYLDKMPIHKEFCFSIPYQYTALPHEIIPPIASHLNCHISLRSGQAFSFPHHQKLTSLV